MAAKKEEEVPPTARELADGVSAGEHVYCYDETGGLHVFETSDDGKAYMLAMAGGMRDEVSAAVAKDVLENGKKSAHAELVVL